MYSDIPGVQILLSLLKQNNIKHLVISPGTRNTPLVHSAECDSFFKCYSIVDERSAAFFALGLSENLDVPVCVTCTAATATCNYMPAIKEAYERNIQLIALTADQNNYSRFHMGDQNINQIDMYTRYVKYSVDVPKIINKDDEWYFNRSVNEALINLNTNGKGPIQINYRMDYSMDYLSYFPEKKLPKTRFIKKYELDDVNWNELYNLIKDKKIVIFCGSDYYSNDDVKKLLLYFQKHTNTVILGDYYSNIIDQNVINPSIIGEVYKDKEINLIKPDLIIIIGSVIYSPIKSNKTLFSSNVESWQISPECKLNDGFRNVKKIFKMTSYDFFKHINDKLNDNDYSDSFYKSWTDIINLVKLPNLKFTNFYIILELIKYIPKNSLVHMSVLNAIRLSNYAKIDKNIKCFANIGADGIDGALSTFLGQASKTNDLCFLIVGDLSYMYDMNALFNSLQSNIRIFVINDYCGSEFHKNFGLLKIPTLNKHTAAKHSTNMKDVSSINNNIKYLSATNEEEFLINIEKFVCKSDKAIVFEIFTDAVDNANKLKEFWNINQSTFRNFKSKIIKKMSNVVSSNTKEKIKRILK